MLEATMISKAQQQGIEFHLATPEDASDMVDFHNTYYGTNREPEHWLWQYHKYEPSKAIFAYAKDGDKLIGTQAVMPVHMMIGNDCVLSGKSENTLILPPYRGTGVMKELYEYAVENAFTSGINFIWGFTDATKAIQKYEFITPPDIAVLERPGNIKLELLSRLQRKATLWRRIGSAFKLLVRIAFINSVRTIPQVQEKAGYEIRKGRIDEHQLEELYERLKSRNKNIIYIKPDKKYLSWRVRGHPFFQYDEYQVLHGTELRAYAFVILSQGTAYISDWLSEDSYATSLLLCKILNDYIKKVARFQFMGNQRESLAEDIFKQLHRFGFSGFNWNFMLRDLSGGKNKQIFDMRNWHITGLWTEGYMC